MNFHHLPLEPSDKEPKLLSKEIHEMSPIEFHAHIVSLYISRDASGNMREEKLQGKISKTATNTRLGEYEVSYTTALGMKKSFFNFNKEKTFIGDIQKLAKELNCGESLVINFLSKKSISLDKISENNSGQNSDASVVDLKTN